MLIGTISLVRVEHEIDPTVQWLEPPVLSPINSLPILLENWDKLPRALESRRSQHQARELESWTLAMSQPDYIKKSW